MPFNNVKYRPWDIQPGMLYIHGHITGVGGAAEVLGKGLSVTHAGGTNPYVLSLPGVGERDIISIQATLGTSSGTAAARPSSIFYDKDEAAGTIDFQLYDGANPEVAAALLAGEELSVSVFVRNSSAS